MRRPDPSAPVDPASVLLTEAQVAERYQVHRATIWRWVARKRLPSPVRMGSHPRWRLSELIRKENESKHRRVPARAQRQAI